MLDGGSLLHVRVGPVVEERGAQHPHPAGPLEYHHGVHRNTARNWVLASMLPSAEKHGQSGGVERWTIAEEEILEIRRDRPPGRTPGGGSLGDEVWVIHDLAIRLADAEARAARAKPDSTN